MAWFGIDDSPRFTYGDTIQINETHFQRDFSLSPVELNDTLQFTCAAAVDGQYVYTQLGSNRSIDLTPISEADFAIC